MDNNQVERKLHKTALVQVSGKRGLVSKFSIKMVWNKSLDTKPTLWVCRTRQHYSLVLQVFLRIYYTG